MNGQNQKENGGYAPPDPATPPGWVGESGEEEARALNGRWEWTMRAMMAGDEGPADEEPGDDDDGEVHSGPFCQHWADPVDCELVCTCGHKCGRHEMYDLNCKDCGCARFADSEDA